MTMIRTSGALLRRVTRHGCNEGAHSLGTDDPSTGQEGAGLADRRSLQADHQGSIIGVTNSAGASIAINSYDEYGIPGAGNQGRFQYTGQAWLPEFGLYHYKARAYSPTLGRFLQTDPIGYGDGMNMYAYVGNDPVNFVDPSGMCKGIRFFGGGADDWKVVICAPRWPRNTLPLPTAPSDPRRWRGPRPPAPEQAPAPQSVPCSSSPSDGILGSARAVLETTATGADIATVGFVAGGITAPVAVATKLVGYGAEAGLLAVNLYDGFANDSWGGLQVQGAGAATRLIPGGRTLQSGLRAARGPTGILRNSRGQFRTSHINNPGVAEAGDLAIQNGAQAATGAVVCR